LAKPDRILSKQVVPKINGAALRRVTDFNVNSEPTYESIYEMGNAGLVEDSITLKESTVSLVANEWGSTDLLAMVYGIYEERTVSASINSLGTITVAARGAGGDWRATATVDDWLHVVRYNAHATTNTHEYVKISAISYDADKGCNVITFDSSYKLTAAATWGDHVGLVNKYTIDEDTIDGHPCHFTVPHQNNATSTLCLHTQVVPRCYCDNFTYTVDVDGTSEINMSFVGVAPRYLLGSRRECYSIAASFVSYTLGTVTFTVPRDSLAATASPYMIYANSYTATMKRINDGGDFASDYAAGAVTRDAFVGRDLDLDSSCQLIYYYTLNNKKGYKPTKNITSSIGKLSKSYVEVRFQGTSSDSDGKLLRCTAFSLSVPQTRISVDELGTDDSIAKPLESNLRQELTLTFNRNDLREFAKMLGETTAFDAGTLTEILESDLMDVKDATITVKTYNSKTFTDSALLETYSFTNCNYIGNSQNTPISGAAGVELKFSTESFSSAGSGNPPKYS